MFFFLTYLLYTGSLPIPPSSVPDIVEFSGTAVFDVQAAIRVWNRGIEAHICETMSLWTFMPPAASSTSVLAFRTMWRRRP